MKERFQQLYEIADSQCGMFTAKQAASVGYSTRVQSYHVQTEHWLREARGIYRLRFYPYAGPTDLMTWYLWSCDQSGNPEGVYSHDTALELHELSTWSGAKLHMTVPKNFKRRVIPKVLRLHSGDLRHFEITHINHVPVTTVTRTLLDLLKADSIPRHHLIEALQDARDRNIITQNDITSPFWTDDERRLLKKLADDALVYTTEA